MKSSQQNNTKQVKLFFESPILSSKPTVSLFPLPEDTQPRSINHMAKFKPFHEFRKPLIGFTPESFLDYIETVLPKDHLCRLVKEVVFSLDTEAIEAKYSFLVNELILSIFFYGDCQLVSVNFLSAFLALPVSIDCAAIFSPSSKSLANPPAMIAAAAFKSPTSLLGL